MRGTGSNICADPPFRLLCHWFAFVECLRRSLFVLEGFLPWSPDWFKHSRHLLLHCLRVFSVDSQYVRSRRGLSQPRAKFPCSPNHSTNTTGTAGTAEAPYSSTHTGVAGTTEAPFSSFLLTTRGTPTYYTARSEDRCLAYRRNSAAGHASIHLLPYVQGRLAHCAARGGQQTNLMPTRRLTPT